MESYRKFIPLTLSLAPIISVGMAEKNIVGFAKSKGVPLGHVSTYYLDVYELDISHYRELKQKFNETRALLEGADHLPQVMVIGLVSVYDFISITVTTCYFHNAPRDCFNIRKDYKILGPCKISLN